MQGINGEVWFHHQDEAWASIESSITDEEEEKFYETCVFTLFATRQISNLGRDRVGRSLAMTLLNLDPVDPAASLRTMLDDVRLVSPTGAGRKGFVAEFRPEKRGLFKLHPHGFGVLGKGTGYYAPTSTLILLLHLLEVPRPTTRISELWPALLGMSA